MSSKKSHKWTFSTRFRRRGFGWKGTAPAKQRLKEALAEIKQVTRHDPVLGAEGAVLLLEKISPALEQIDSSSGAIGTAVYNTIEALAPIIAEAPADEALRDKWLWRLWQAVQEDDIPYIEQLADYWGELCATPECASRWADELMQGVRFSWSPNPEMHGFFKGTPACLSTLLKAGRNEELLKLLELAPHKHWHDRKWGVKALAAMGRNREALEYAQNSQGLNVPPASIARACEGILLADGKFEEAYERYALLANQKLTYLATFQALVKKYTHKERVDILNDLARGTPGEEGKWFAAARWAGLYTEAIKLANTSSCDPKTLTRAARDLKQKEPNVAVEAGMAALRWLVKGYGYEITGLDVMEAYRQTMLAAEIAGTRNQTQDRIRNLVAGETFGDRFVTKILGRELQ